MGVAREAGQAALVARLHELFRAVGRRDEQLAARVRRLGLVRGVPQIVAEIDKLACRLGGLGLRLDLRTLPRRKPTVAQALGAAGAVLGLLRRHAPHGDRLLLVEAIWAARSGRHPEALHTFARLLHKVREGRLDPALSACLDTNVTLSAAALADRTGRHADHHPATFARGTKGGRSTPSPLDDGYQPTDMPSFLDSLAPM